MELLLGLILGVLIYKANYQSKISELEDTIQEVEDKLSKLTNRFEYLVDTICEEPTEEEIEEFEEHFKNGLFTNPDYIQNTLTTQNK